MARVQLALNVGDLDAAVSFYSALFGVAPAKRRPGYANFVVADPPLKLVLLAGEPGTLNHLGVEVETPAQVALATERLSGAGLATAVEEATSCCYALQDKVWVRDPDGTAWEHYVVLDDAEELGRGPGPAEGAASRSACCGATTVNLRAPDVR